MELENTENALKDGYESLLLSYAAGTVDQAQDLIVASHLSISEKGREAVKYYEAIGGAILDQECSPEDMNAGSLENVLNHLNEKPGVRSSQSAAAQTAVFPEDISLPSPLNHALSAQQESLGWKFLLPGMKIMDLNLACKRSSARFLKIGAGVKTPHHSHAGMEITLVLDGAFTDETGAYKRGDLIVTDETCHHTPVADMKSGCVCMVVSTAPIRLKGWASILNPFIKY